VINLSKESLHPPHPKTTMTDSEETKKTYPLSDCPGSIETITVKKIGTIITVGESGVGKSMVANHMRYSESNKFKEHYGATSVTIDCKYSPALLTGWDVCDTPPLFDINKNNIDVIKAAFEKASLGLIKICFVVTTIHDHIDPNQVRTLKGLMHALPSTCTYSIVVNLSNYGTVDQEKKCIESFFERLDSSPKLHYPEQILFFPDMYNNNVQAQVPNVLSYVHKMGSNKIDNIGEIKQYNFE